MSLYKMAYPDDPQTNGNRWISYQDAMNGNWGNRDGYTRLSMEDPGFWRGRAGQKFVQQFGANFNPLDWNHAKLVIGTPWEAIVYPKGVPAHIINAVASDYVRNNPNSRMSPYRRQRHRIGAGGHMVAVRTPYYTPGSQMVMDQLKPMQMLNAAQAVQRLHANPRPNDPLWVRQMRNATAMLNELEPTGELLRSVSPGGDGRPEDHLVRQDSSNPTAAKQYYTLDQPYQQYDPSRPNGGYYEAGKQQPAQQQTVQQQPAADDQVWQDKYEGGMDTSQRIARSQQFDNLQKRGLTPGNGKPGYYIPEDRRQQMLPSEGAGGGYVRFRRHLAQEDTVAQQQQQTAQPQQQQVPPQSGSPANAAQAGYRRATPDEYEQPKSQQPVQQQQAVQQQQQPAANQQTLADAMVTLNNLEGAYDPGNPNDVAWATAYKDALGKVRKLDPGYKPENDAEWIANAVMDAEAFRHRQQQAPGGAAQPEAQAKQPAATAQTAPVQPAQTPATPKSQQESPASKPASATPAQAAPQAEQPDPSAQPAAANVQPAAGQQPQRTTAQPPAQATPKRPVTPATKRPTTSQDASGQYTLKRQPNKWWNPYDGGVVTGKDKEGGQYVAVTNQQGQQSWMKPDQLGETQRKEYAKAKQLERLRSNPPRFRR